MRSSGVPSGARICGLQALAASKAQFTSSAQPNQPGQVKAEPATKIPDSPARARIGPDSRGGPRTTPFAVSDRIPFAADRGRER